MSEWKEYKLGDLLTLEYGKSLKGYQETINGVPVYGTNGPIGFTDEPLCSIAGIIVGRKGAYRGVHYSPNPFFVIDTAFYVKLKVDYIDIGYLYNFLLSQDINAMDSGSAIPSTDRYEIYKINILLPPLPEQRAITAMLSSLDNKIDLLHRQNQSLEAMAETLFRQWFVEEANEGWEDGTIADLCHTITKGTTPTTLGYNFSETGINFVKAESITDTGDFIWEKFAKINIDTHNFLNRSILQEGDVLCSIAGTIGRLAIATKEILPANTNQAIAIIRVNRQKCFPEFIYLFLKSPQFKAIMDGKIVHAVQPNLSLGEIGNTPISIPSALVMNNFQKLISPLFAKKRFNTFQICTLEKLRDTLLPKLMSGEVRIEV